MLKLYELIISKFITFILQSILFFINEPVGCNYLIKDYFEFLTTNSRILNESNLIICSSLMKIRIKSNN